LRFWQRRFAAPWPFVLAAPPQLRVIATAARQLGLISEGELSAPAATPAQLAQIAAAGRVAALRVATR
jgi:cellobiose-specific phosphotransferase system component IIC